MPAADSIEVPEQRDLRPVLCELAVDVQDYVGERELTVQRAWWALTAPLESDLVEAVEASAPAGVGLFSEGQAPRGRAGPLDRSHGQRAIREVVVDPERQPRGDVTQAPGDRRHRRRLRLRPHPVDGEAPVRPWPHAPAAGSRFPEVLVIGKALEPRPQDRDPLKVKLAS